MTQQEFSIIPVLGRKTDVPQNDPSLFQDYGGNVAVHDVGGINYDLARKRHACAKMQGYSTWSNAANATATNCLGLFELYSGGNRDHIYADSGVIYVYELHHSFNYMTGVDSITDDNRHDAFIIHYAGYDRNIILEAISNDIAKWKVSRRLAA